MILKEPVNPSLPRVQPKSTKTSNIQFDLKNLKMALCSDITLNVVIKKEIILRCWSVKGLVGVEGPVRLNCTTQP